MHRSCHSILMRAFTLVELLAVMAVIVIMMALIGPATNNVMQAQQLQSGGRMVEDHLTMARRLAVTRNEPVYVFLCQSGPDKRDTLFLSAKADGSELLAVPLRLPIAVVLSDDTGWSPLGAVETVEVTLQGESLSARRFSFRAAGNLSLAPSQAWHLTLHLRGKPEATNFATVAINPITGVASTYRP